MSLELLFARAWLFLELEFRAFLQILFEFRFELSILRHSVNHTSYQANSYECHF